MRTAMRFIDARVPDARAQVHLHDLARPRRPQRRPRTVDGKKQVIPGEGIGSNYWDLLPFGGEDALATIYYYDTLLKPGGPGGADHRPPRMERRPGADAFDPTDLRQHAQRSKTTATSASGTKRPAASEPSISTACCTTTA